MSTFRKRNALAVHDMHYGPNMTPMVDVVMVILIFFMASAVFLGPEWFLRTALPKVAASTGASADEKPTQVRVAIERTGAAASARIDDGALITIDAAIRALDTLAREKTPAKIVVLVQPTEDAPYEAVVRVHEACERLKISKVGLMGE